ncbi:hypothetical protein NP493_998g00040 [Ridgeia piscesae]|uniref:Uncharacterized protein n=1 Tax=Ridgeia piscesae TaxID=27915 RepID=A0AAD9KJV6_RIDPI|nr:hypothetical protein NP493_998g00040 [Ridgeia piscesae]
MSNVGTRSLSRIRLLIGAAAAAESGVGGDTSDEDLLNSLKFPDASEFLRVSSSCLLVNGEDRGKLSSRLLRNPRLRKLPALDDASSENSYGSWGCSCGDGVLSCRFEPNWCPPGDWADLLLKSGSCFGRFTECCNLQAEHP